MRANWTTLADSAVESVTPELQGMLTDLVDLHLMGKQAHWTVVGERFRPVHQHLDELVAVWRTWTDQVAERVVTLGQVPRGQATDVAAAGELDPLPADWTEDAKLVAAVADRVEQVARRTRRRQAAVAPHDPVSDNLIGEILAGLEQQLWMLRAQTS